jgi:hypothetical protein
MIKKWTNFYGAHPLQPVLMLAGLVVAGYAVLRVSGDGAWMRILIWFFAAVIAHDLVLFPLYAAADGLLVRLVSRHSPVKHSTAKHGPVKHGTVKRGTVNYVRLPVLATGLTFLIFLPGIIEQGAVTYHNATLLTQAPYLHRWLLLVAGFFVVSALVFAVRRLPFRGRMRADEPRPDEPSVGAEPGEVAHPTQ